jgi:hypothetical protein
VTPAANCAEVSKPHPVLAAFVEAPGGPLAVTIVIMLGVPNFRAGGAYGFGDVLPAGKPLLWVRDRRAHLALFCDHRLKAGMGRTRGAMLCLI